MFINLYYQILNTIFKIESEVISLLLPPYYLILISLQSITFYVTLIIFYFLQIIYPLFLMRNYCD